MAKFWLSAAVGLYLLQLCLAQISLNISCRFAGVFHVEKNRRYSLTREEAVELCQALNSTLPTWEQMDKAYHLGLETCRYGYIEEKIVLPRHTPYPLCAANNTGIYVLQTNISERYDTYCFNSSETRDKVCDPVKDLYTPWPENQTNIEIYNADGTRYIGGKQFTEQTPVTDDDSNMGSGSANDRGTTDPTVIKPGVLPTELDEDFTPNAVHPIADVTSPDSDDMKDRVPNREDQHPRTTNPGSDHPEDTESQQGDSTPKSQDRLAHIPDWLIVVASLLALALILGVCIAVNSRRRCGQKQKLVINNGKGAVDNKNMGGLNGEASKSHEMVHLVHKEKPEDQTGPHDEFLQIDETNNLQEVDLKSGV